MRLIDVNTLELKEFHGTETPPYAILSHVWGNEEVTFLDWERRTDNDIRRKEGYAKIVGACRRAHKDGFQYLWCDTNCIDKRSSAELTEAINSMFAWYRDSRVCYAYLFDVETKDTFANTRWFSRGWTLQELLAPSEVVFFDRRWSVLGNRKTLAALISDTARIHIGALMDRETIYDYSIAQRMSWAAARETTRAEDIAYCLLGIFDINMPLLYGEGQKAFARLQQEIINISADQSIFAWDSRYSDPHPWTSALAFSPANFRFCGSIIEGNDIQHTPYSVANLGISINLSLMETLVRGVVLVGLNCAKELWREGPRSQLPNGTKLRRHFQVWIPLCRLQYNTYVRAHHPSSKIFLQQSYPGLRHPTPTELFLSLNASRNHTVQLPLNHIEPLRQYLSCKPTGMLVKIASGKMTHDRQMFREVYPLGNITIVGLKGRSTSTISNQLISCGDLSIIFSVLWDKEGLPLEWLHTAIFDPKLEVIKNLASRSELSYLFEPSNPPRSSQTCNATAMHSLHSKLREAYGKPSTKEQKSPIVIIEDIPLRDSFGDSELIVEIIFT